MADPQKRKVYLAEEKVCGFNFRSLESAQAFVDRITRSRYWERRTKVRHVELGRTARDNEMTGAIKDTYRRGRILIRKKYNVIEKILLLHELTHIIEWEVEEYDHGPQFCKTYLEMVRRWEGPEAEAELREQFDKRGVDYGQT